MSVLYNKAVFLVDRRRYDLAERELRRAIAEDPGHAPSHALLGICLAHMGRGNEAIAVAQEAIRLDPGLAFAHYARARVQLRLRGRRGLGRAKKDVAEAIRLDVGRSDFIFLLAAILSDQGRAKLSLEQAELGLRLDPEHAGCASLRALALQRLGRGHEAEAAINWALALAPEDDFTHSAQGWRLMQRGDARRAAGHFREALRINPENRWAEFGLKATRRLAFRVFRARDLFKVLGVATVIPLIAAGFGGTMIPLAVAIVIATQVGLAVAVCSTLDRLRGR